MLKPRPESMVVIGYVRNGSRVKPGMTMSIEAPNVTIFVGFVSFVVISLTRRPGHRAAAQYMQMNMEHGLPCSLVAVHDQAVTIFGNSLVVGDFLRR